MWLPPTWDICGLGLSKWVFICINFIYIFSSIFYTFSSVEPPKCCRTTSTFNSPISPELHTWLFHHTEKGVHLFGSCTINAPRNCIKCANNFFSSTPQYSWFENFLNYLCLIMYFPRRADADSPHLGMAEGTASRPGQDDWAGKPALIQIIPQRTRERRDSALPFCEATVLHNHAYGQHRINTSQTSLYLPVWASLRTTNLFPAKRSSSWKQKIVGLII